MYTIVLLFEGVGAEALALQIAESNCECSVVGEPSRGKGEQLTAIETSLGRQSLHSRRPSQILLLEPRGLSRIQSAAYIGVSPALFDEMVADGRMPQPKKVNSRIVWDRKRLDECFEALPDKEDRNPWDDEDAA
jgi:hypothetical protein